ncbi:MAG: FoF1 ATP synthase subunit gamma [Candidatus Roizmanbacteria bacterium]|nr:FoF1 ATP synthase subunit gamma [Candidatus Roizmanbacteria bacterium]
MQSKEIVEEQKFMQVLQDIATAYQDISVMKMKETRTFIDHARLYVSMLKDIFESLRYSHTLLKRLKGNPNAKKPLAKILITANTKFHGDILRRIFEKFLDDKDEKGDVFLVGRVGKDLLAQYGQKTDAKLFDISDINMKMGDLKPLIYYLLQYKKIYVYHARFKSVVTQDPEVSEITNINKLLEEELEAEKEERKLKEIPPTYLFEPAGEKIVSFLNNNVIISLLRQAVLETQLARFAARLNAMDSLLSRIDENMDSLKKQQRKINHDLSNKKQLERISGMFFWNQ